jgi:hypothetical protein
LNKAKETMYPDDWEKRVDAICDGLVIPGKFISYQKWMESFSFASPISPQGMLIFGAITSAWSLRLAKGRAFKV